MQFAIARSLREALLDAARQADKEEEDNNQKVYTKPLLQ